ncbi:MAG: hypothetical protein AB7I50_01110 [Vicinamibacterales bacterium]
MKKMFVLGAALALASSAHAAPNVTNITQKGSLIVFTDIRVDNLTAADPMHRAPGGVTYDTLVRIQNDGSSDVDVKCYWLDGFKNRVDFIIPVTRNQAVWFDARTGRGTFQVNPFPTGAANGFTSGNRHPFLDIVTNIAQNPVDGVGDGYGPYRRGMLACWAVDNAAQNQVKWNHLSGTATVYDATRAYEYHAFSFYVPTGADLAAVGTAGTLNLNGLEYDACPLYLIGQFTPGIVTGGAPNTNTAVFAAAPAIAGAPQVSYNRLAIAGCNINLNQDWTPVWTKLQFDVWNSEEVKFTGAFECADTWHETDFRPGYTPQGNGVLNPAVPGFVDGVDSAGQNFDFNTLRTYAARYRVQGVASSQCNRTKSGSSDTVAAVTTQGVGVIAVQSSALGSAAGTGELVGTPLAAAGKANGRVVWDPEGVVPEGGLR